MHGDVKVQNLSMISFMAREGNQTFEPPNPSAFCLMMIDDPISRVDAGMGIYPFGSRLPT